MAAICRESELLKLMKNYKNIFLGLLLLAFTCQTLWAATALTEETNLLKNIRKAVQNTFDNPVGFFDGVIDSDPQFSAFSQDIYGKIQQIVIEPPAPAYLREAKIYWDLNQNYDNYFVQYTVDGRSWFTARRTISRILGLGLAGCRIFIAVVGGRRLLRGGLGLSLALALGNVCGCIGCVGAAGTRSI